MKTKLVHEAHQIDEEAWKVSDKDISKVINAVTVKSFNFNNIWWVTVARLETSSSQKSATLEYEINTYSNGNLMYVDMFKILFPKQQWQN